MGTLDSPGWIFDSPDLSILSSGPELSGIGETRGATLDPAAGAQHQRRMANAYEMLRQYSTTNQPSRPSSPKSVQAHQQYLQNLGRLSPVACDSTIANVFIGLFYLYVAPNLPCFKDYVLDSSTPEEVSLTMAAVGGLYCETPKSTVVARWLFHTAQRKLNTLVRTTIRHDLFLRSHVLEAREDHYTGKLTRFVFSSYTLKSPTVLCTSGLSSIV